MSSAKRDEEGRREEEAGRRGCEGFQREMKSEWKNDDECEGEENTVSTDGLTSFVL
jgi:hypothetical protein